MPYRSFQVKNKFSCDSNALFLFFLFNLWHHIHQNLWMFFQGWRDWRRNILKFFGKGHVFNNDCCFCILVSQCLKIADSYKCGVGLEHRKFSIMLSTIMKSKRNVRAKELQNRLQKPVLGKETLHSTGSRMTFLSGTENQQSSQGCGY